MEEYLLNELHNFIKSNHWNIYGMIEAQRPTRTRSEAKFKPETAAEAVKAYTNQLWDGITERLTHCDKDGTTGWSEAPSEAIFSILGYIVENKPSLTFGHMISLCRVVREGPPPGCAAASTITKHCLDKWGGRPDSKRFLTNEWMYGLTSKTVSNELNKKFTLL